MKYLANVVSGGRRIWQTATPLSRAPDEPRAISSLVERLPFWLNGGMTPHGEEKERHAATYSSGSEVLGQ